MIRASRARAAGALAAMSATVVVGRDDIRSFARVLNPAFVSGSGTAMAALFGPLLAQRFGWTAVFGVCLLPLAAAFTALALLAKEPPDNAPKSLGGSLRILAEKDTWVFNLLYVVTFGGFIGLTSFLPTFFHENYGVSKVLAG